MGGYTDLHRRLHDALGFEPGDMVRRIVVEAAYGEPVIVTVERYVHDDTIGAVAEVCEDYTLMPRVEPVGPHGLTRAEEQAEMRAAAEPTDLDDTGEPW